MENTLELDIQNLRKKISLLEWDIKHIDNGEVKELKNSQLKNYNQQLYQLLEKNKLQL